jgi:hypothetical protein
VFSVLALVVANPIGLLVLPFSALVTALALVFSTLALRKPEAISIVAPAITGVALLLDVVTRWACKGFHLGIWG